MKLIFRVLLFISSSLIFTGCTHHGPIPRAWDEGYELGQADTIKRHHQLLQNLHAGDPPSDWHWVYYEFELPETNREGQLLRPGRVTLPVYESK